MSAAIDEIIQQIHEEAAVAILENIKVLRNKDVGEDVKYWTRENTKTLLEVLTRY